MTRSQPLPQGFRAPKQARSQASLDRIVEATLQLIETVPIDQLSLRRIAEEADVSLASLYERFRSKEALLDHVHALVCDDRRVVLASFFAEMPDGVRLTPAIVRQGIARYMDIHRRYRATVRNLQRHCMDHPRIGSRERRFQRDANETVRRFVVDAMPDRDPITLGQQVDSLLLLFVEWARGALDAMDGASDAARPAQDERMEEMIRLALRSIGLEESPTEVPPGLS